MQSTGLSSSTTVTFLIVAIVVVRFALRELKPRVVKVRYLWIRPGFLIVMTLLLLALAVVAPGMSITALAGSLLVGGALGAFTGLAVVRLSQFATTGRRGQVLVSGSWKTAAVWIVAVLFRLVAHVAIPTSTKAMSLTLNVGLLLLVTVAFIVVATGFHRAVDRYSETAA
jgi:hypothetical protein